MTDLNIDKYQTIIKPIELKSLYKVKNSDTIQLIRNDIISILNKESSKKIMIVGPCSIHDVKAAKEYANNLLPIRNKYSDKLLILMRVYFEKPRTTVGWKGLINDPDLNGTYDINKGLNLARELLVYINDLGIGVACEFLDTIIPQYLSDVVSWGAIGARTTESQIHRELVSGLSMPIGFKNGTGGDIEIARDAIISSSYPHTFLGINEEAVPSVVLTTGNRNTHIILRGGKQNSNYDTESVKKTTELLLNSNLVPNIMIDISHGNSRKNYKNQESVASNIAEQMKTDKNIIGLMIESNLVEGKQKICDDMVYGKSITDCCINLITTENIFKKIYDVV